MILKFCIGYAVSKLTELASAFAVFAIWKRGTHYTRENKCLKHFVKI